MDDGKPATNLPKNKILCIMAEWDSLNSLSEELQITQVCLLSPTPKYTYFNKLQVQKLIKRNALAVTKFNLPSTNLKNV